MSLFYQKTLLKSISFMPFYGCIREYNTGEAFNIPYKTFFSGLSWAV